MIPYDNEGFKGKEEERVGNKSRVEKGKPMWNHFMLLRLSHGDFLIHLLYMTLFKHFVCFILLICKNPFKNIHFEVITKHFH